MAIKKTKELKNGFSGEYWKIIAEYYDRVCKKCTWQIALFKDQSASTVGKVHMGVIKSYTKALTPEDLLLNRTAVGYAHIKTQASRLVPLFNDPEGDPVPFDADLANGEDV